MNYSVCFKVIQAISLDKYIKYRTGSYLSKGRSAENIRFYMKYFIREYQCHVYANEYTHKIDSQFYYRVEKKTS